MAVQRKLKLAVVGAGNITSLRHIPAFLASKRVEILGVIDHTLSRAKAVAERFTLPHYADSPQAPWFEEADAVTIGVPPASHYPVARAAIEAGKHVLLEKPMTLEITEAEHLVKLSKERGRILALVHNFQFARSALALKRLLASGKLGEITGILCFQCSTKDRRLPVWHESLPLGLFYDEAPHLLYLLRAFGGDVAVQSVTVSKSPSGHNTPAVITAHLRAGSVPAVLYNNFEAPISEWHFTVYGSKAAGVIDVFRDVLVTIPNDGQHLSMDVMRTTASAVGTHLLGVARSGLAMVRGKLLYGNEEVVRRFLDAIETGIPPKDISAEDGLQVVRLQHEIIELAGKNSHSVIPGT